MADGPMADGQWRPFSSWSLAIGPSAMRDSVEWRVKGRAQRPRRFVAPPSKGVADGPRRRRAGPVAGAVPALPGPAGQAPGGAGPAGQGRPVGRGAAGDARGAPRPAAVPRPRRGADGRLAAADPAAQP